MSNCCQFNLLKKDLLCLLNMAAICCIKTSSELKPLGRKLSPEGLQERKGGGELPLHPSLTSRRLSCWASCLLAVCSGNYKSVIFFLFLRLTQWTAGYAEAQFRQYQRLTRQIRPDYEGYEKQREEWWVKPLSHLPFLLLLCMCAFKYFIWIDRKLNTGRNVLIALLDLCGFSLTGS